jgi:hypothetical protein
MCFKIFQAGEKRMAEADDEEENRKKKQRREEGSAAPAQGNYQYHSGSLTSDKSMKTLWL